MPISIILVTNNVDGSGSNLFYPIGTLTFSGNYSIGGDTLDFTTVADRLPSDQSSRSSPTARTATAAITCRCREAR